MSLFDKFLGGSKIYDCETYRQAIPGILAKSPVPQVNSEGVLSAWLNPDDKSLLTNRNGKPNVNGLLEVKAKIDSKGLAAVSEAVKALGGQRVLVWGVQVNNDALDGKVELFPVDMIAGALSVERFPAWASELQKNLKDPAAVSLYRVLAASDASTSHHPPKGQETRSVKTAFPYPAQPQLPQLKFAFEVRPLANFRSDFQLNDDMLKKNLDFHLTVSGQKNDGPGVFAADILLFWADDNRSIR